MVRNRKQHAADKRQPVREAVIMHTNILSMIRNYEAFNFLDDSLTTHQKLQNKLELREIKMSSILLRMKANKKLQEYYGAYSDAQKLWYLMSPSER